MPVSKWQGYNNGLCHTLDRASFQIVIGAVLVKRTVTCVSMLVALVAFMIDCQMVSAQAVVIPHTDSGSYSETGFHNSTNPNYVVGDSRGFPGSCGDCRNFFVFDLSGVTQPIVSAKLALFVPSSDLGPGFVSGDPSENYELHDVITSIATLQAGTGGVAAHTDLGSGVVYGSRTMTAADMGSVIEITLNASAIAALDAATGLIGIGGSLTTLDGSANNEYTFGTSGSLSDIRELRLTLAPEPSTFLLLGIGAISLLGYRRRTR